MGFKILNIDKSESDKFFFESDSTPLTYRISLSLENNEIVLRREYFYVVYKDGEQLDNNYFIDNVYVTYASFITRNFDEDYLIKKERKLIKVFYNKLKESEVRLNKEKVDTNRYLDNKIKRYKKFQNCGIFDSIIRKSKLIKLGNLE